MTQHYVVEVETDAAPTADVVDAVMEALVDVHPTVTSGPAQTAVIVVTVPADSLRQAVSTTLSLVAGSLPTVAAVGVSAVPEHVRDVREGWAPVPELLSTTEAARVLGVSRQRVGQMIHEGVLPAEKVGPTYAVPKDAVIARRGRSTAAATPA